MLHNFCSFSASYSDTLKSLSNSTNISAADIIVQFPFTAAVSRTIFRISSSSPCSTKSQHLKIGEPKTEEQLAQIAEKRREAGRRLQDQAAKNRAEKVREHAFRMAIFVLLRTNPAQSLLPYAACSKRGRLQTSPLSQGLEGQREKGRLCSGLHHIPNVRQSGTALT
jgi:hypothetical protein